MTDLNSEYIGVTSIVGEEGSCKSSMALTWPKPLFHFEFDVGGFDRAIWRFEKEFKVLRLKMEDNIPVDCFEKYDIVTKPYPVPLDVTKLMGQITEGKRTEAKFTVRFPKKVEGMKELWQSIVTDFVPLVQMKKLKSIIFDTSTMHYNIAHKTILQELQERQLYNHKSDAQRSKYPFDENSFRERLQPTEYGFAYDKLRQVYQTASAYRKNTVSVHYPTDEYIKNPDQASIEKDIKSGNKKPDGWQELNKLADLIAWTMVKEVSMNGQKLKLPMCKITKCGIAGMGLDAVGKELTASFESIIQERDRMRGDAK
jgi:hypothetical protein